MKNQTISLSTDSINRVRVIVADLIASGVKTNMKTWIEEAIKQRDIADNVNYVTSDELADDQPKPSRF